MLFVSYKTFWKSIITRIHERFLQALEYFRELLYVFEQKNGIFLRDRKIGTFSNRRR